jgi:hypothetical protein
MTITSTAFQPNDPIPSVHSYDGGNVSPPLTFSEVPVEAKSLALLIEDPDAVSGLFTHWVLFNIPPATLQIMEGQVPSGAIVGKNDFGEQSYGGPKPPSGTHKYFFNLFALDSSLAVGSDAGAEEVREAMKGHIIDRAEIIGMYSATPHKAL